ncbi:MAG: 2'-5' RNA ligase family protein [Rothia sp. (in: high G+C Gram-positive bacteria)]|uniref:2'-5' RNA ligase family protein n=1 Tax=Rothia sp. (in: high G+C Gram-positive bacteria) TaxID=1885016 RepID=UPI0026E10677|nr:2'-5' RNA ligase family protein [Rothia sp. (in: high G+C Gram-positive bacteria)]MDO5750244.1 2'-5' RNA ligase family protein [Rothia sp. (in: high G+C Gram-positive bacteria)]
MAIVPAGTGDHEADALIAAVSAEASSQPPSSPTLLEGKSYLSLIAHVPAQLSARVLDFKRSVGLEDPMNAHITVYVGELTDERAQMLSSAEFARSLQQLGTFQTALGAVASFRPVTEIDYLAVTEGFEHFESLRERCIAALGKSASPFPYVPHMTLGNGLSEAQREQLEREFSSLPAQEERFMVRTLHAYAFDGSLWQPLGAIALDGGCAEASESVDGG